MKTETEQIYRERILKVLLHIQSHLDEDLELDGLASLACFSPFHFHRIFKGMVGEAVGEHIRRLRLERAVYQIRRSGRSILDIALDAGYETHESFTRAFRAMFGLPPSSLRRKRRALLFRETDSRVHFRPGGKSVNFKPRKTGGKEMDVKIKKIEPIRVAFVRHIGPYEECEPAWEKLCSWAGPKGLLGPATRVIGISHDDPEVTPPEKLRYDACVSVGDEVEAEGEIGIQVIEGGDYAVTTHKGPYTKLIGTYAEIFGRWAPRSGRVLKQSPCFELYRNDPHSTPPEELLTDIYIPLEEG